MGVFVAAPEEDSEILFNYLHFGPGSSQCSPGILYTSRLQDRQARAQPLRMSVLACTAASPLCIMEDFKEEIL